MRYQSKITHQVGGSTVTVRELSGPTREFRVTVDGEKYEVFLGNPTDPGTDPNRWYTEIGGTVEGPWDTAEELIAKVFLTEQGY